MNSATEKVTKPVSEHILGKFIDSQNIVIKATRLALLLLLSFVSLVRLLNAISYLSGNQVYKKDFLQLYVLSRAVSERINPYMDMPALVSRYVGISSSLFPHATPYPPSVGIIFLPLSLFSYETAVVFWFVFEIACLIGSICLLLLPASNHFSINKIAVITIIVLLYWPIRDELQLANVNMVLLLILSGMRFAYYKEHKVVTGILFGLSLLIKQIFWPVIFIFILFREWKIIISTILTTIIGYLISGLVVGFDKLWMNIFKVIPAITNYYSRTPWNISLLSLSTRIFKGLGMSADQPVQMSFLSAPPLINFPAGVFPFWFALELIILLVFYYFLRSIRNFDSLLGVSICISILLSPLVWAYYLVFLLIPIIYILTTLWKEKFPRWKTNVVILLVGFQLISLQKWIDVGIHAAGRSMGFVYEPGANIVPFWSGLFGLIVVIGIFFIIFFLAYLDKNSQKINHSE
jgi:hypothetical protein